jgi:hypothetical protein
MLISYLLVRGSSNQVHKLYNSGMPLRCIHRVDTAAGQRWRYGNTNPQDMVYMQSGLRMNSNQQGRQNWKTIQLRIKRESER